MDSNSSALVAAAHRRLNNRAVPLPATVVMVPPDILRMRWFTESAMYRLPEESNVRPKGKFNSALVGAPLSPEKPSGPVTGIGVDGVLLAPGTTQRKKPPT